MITEARVDAEVVSRLPPGSWIRRYIDWARTCNQAHLLYHVGVGLAVYSQAIPISTRIPLAGSPVYAPIFVLLEGSPGSSHKTISIHTGVQVLRAGLPEFEAQSPGSREVFADDMILQGKRLIVMPEFGAFLSASNPNSYLNSVRAAFNDAFDGSPIARDTMTKRSKGKKEAVTPLYDQKQMNPRLSLLCGCAPAYLEENTSHQDWDGGFMSRFWIAYVERERPDVRTPMDDGQAAELGGLLRNEMSRLEQGARDSCRGFDEDAWSALDAFRAELHALLTSGRVPKGVHGTVSRCDLQAMKIALILACAAGRSATANWLIGRAEMETAITLARLSMESAFATAEHLAATRDMRDRRAVLSAVGKDHTSVASIIHASHLLQKRVQEILMSLMAEEIITPTTNGFWRLRTASDPLNSAMPAGAADPFADSPLAAEDPSATDASPAANSYTV